MTLYIVATPIGNLEDITLRALRILKEVDFILAEDTRVTKKLLQHYNIVTPLISYHQHSRLQKVDYVAQLILSGKNLALVSDAGTPGISDPGNQLIHELFRRSLDMNVVPIPGASAIAALSSISGMAMDNFLFLGFPPHKKGRNKYFARVLSNDVPVIFFESKHRILKTLQELHAQIVTNSQNYDIVLGRELTKQFEHVYRGDMESVISQLKEDKILGEFALIISKIKKQDARQ